MDRKLTSEYTYFNHHHRILDDQEKVEIGGQTFIADRELIPLLKALVQAKLRTRTHCSGHGSGHAFVAILLDEGMEVSIRPVTERDSGRADYEGERELLISWNNSHPGTGEGE